MPAAFDLFGFVFLFSLFGFLLFQAYKIGEFIGEEKALEKIYGDKQTPPEKR